MIKDDSIDNIRYNKKRNIQKEEDQSFELKNIYDADKYKPTKKEGLGERFYATFNKYLSTIHQVNPESQTIETYGSVLRRSLNLASVMVEKGVDRSSVIVIMSKNKLDRTIVMLATHFCGAICAPFEFSDHHEENYELLGFLNPTLIFADSIFINAIHTFKTKIKNKVEIIDMVRHKYLFSKQYYSNNVKMEIVKIENPKKACAYIIPTQGSSSNRKLVRISHYAIMYQLNYLKDVLFKDIRIAISLLPFVYFMQIIFICYSFDNPMTRIYSTPTMESYVLKVVHDFEIDSIITSPFYITKLGMNNCVTDYKLVNLKRIFLGGTPLGRRLTNEVFNSFATTQLFVWYGTSETGLISGHEIYRSETAASLLDIINCGFLYPGVRAKFADIQTQTPVHANILGEICIQTSTMMLAYQMETPVTVEPGFFRTGDIGYYDDNASIYVKGMIQEILIKFGQTFCAIEIEDVIFQNPQVNDVAVIQKDIEIYACVVKEEFVSLTPERLMKYVCDRLPENKTPDCIMFFDTIPATPIGNVRRYLGVDNHLLLTQSFNEVRREE